jgi:hypothetical protein
MTAMASLDHDRGFEATFHPASNLANSLVVATLLLASSAVGFLLLETILL